MTWIVPEAAMRAVPERLLRLLRERAERAMRSTIDMAVADVKRFIASRPRPTSEYGGRIQSRDLINSISGRVFWEGSVVRGEVFHSDGGKDYYILQIGGGIGGGSSDYNTGGFRHWISGEYIESSFAARDAALLATQNLLRQLGAK